ncbi:MAG TPA: cysteine synthase A, partial [Myxococcota bacterium]|nr:cysteine synthase A [Myxococcota bacterium]
MAARIYESVLETIGRTPLVRLSRFARGARADVLGKMESRNPGASVKDRVGLAMIEDAERRGALKPGATLVEPTSGNTGIALAMVAAVKGYRLVLTMPETMSRERIALLRHLGAEVVLTPGTLMREAVERARQLVREMPGAVMLQQFDNPANPEAHRRTTAQEIWDDAGGRVDVLVAGVGTGGTVTGCGEVLKQKNASLWVVAVEPAAAAALSGGRIGHHYLQGLGAGFVPSIVNRRVIDEVLTCTEDDAVAEGRRLVRTEGILGGLSCGAAAWAALQVARRPGMDGKVVVVVLPDTGERYLSTPLFDRGPTSASGSGPVGVGSGGVGSGGAAGGGGGGGGG